MTLKIQQIYILPSKINQLKVIKFIRTKRGLSVGWDWPLCYHQQHPLLSLFQRLLDAYNSYCIIKISEFFLFLNMQIFRRNIFLFFLLGYFIFLQELTRTYRKPLQMFSRNTIHCTKTKSAFQLLHIGRDLCKFCFLNQIALVPACRQIVVSSSRPFRQDDLENRKFRLKQKQNQS